MAGRKKSVSIFPILIIATIFIGLFCASVYISLNPGFLEGASKTSPTPTLSPTPTPYVASKPNAACTAVLCSIDTDNSTMLFFVPADNSSITLKYNKATYFYDAYNQSKTVSYYAPGDIAELSYYSDTAVLSSVSPSDDVWEYHNISVSTFNISKQLVQIKERNYRVNSSTSFFKTEKNVSFSELHSLDYVTVRGIGDTAYSVILTKGHGRLVLDNASDFIGGFLFKDEHTYCEITKATEFFDFEEGTYVFAVKHDDRYGEKELTITADGATIFDLSEYKDDAPQKGTVSFEIEPANAELFINNKLYDHNQPITLNHGTYSINVLLSGYVSHMDTLTIDSSAKNIQVFLTKENVVSDNFKPTLTPTPSPTPTAAPTPTSSPTPTSTPTPAPTETPVPTPSPIPKDILLVYWYPNKDIYLDAKLVGKTDAYGMLTLEPLTPGAHIFSLASNIYSLEYKIVEILSSQNYINLYYY